MKLDVSCNTGDIFDRCELKLNVSDNMWYRYPVPKITVSQMKHADGVAYLPSMQVVPSLNPKT
jgi:hypothetical protein